MVCAVGSDFSFGRTGLGHSGNRHSPRVAVGFLRSNSFGRGRHHW